jgi:precorrin-3B synthase
MRLREAADGWLARVRLVGGFLTAQGFSALADCSEELGDGRVELTSRGNVQLRGLAAEAGAELGERLHSAGLWPSLTHERVRNIMASPLAGVDTANGVEQLVHALDRGLCAAPRLSALSGRFSFAVDDGRNDVAALGADVVVRPDSVNGLLTDEPVAMALAMAEALLDECAAEGSNAWRIADLVDGPDRVRARVAHLSTGAARDVEARTQAPPAGPVRRPDGGTALVLAVPLGRLDSVHLRWLAEATGPRTARVTPWRSIVLAEVDPSLIQAAAELGFGVTPDTPWSKVSACAGRPGCAKALADVQADARAAITRWPGRVVHWSGCSRRCGRPANTEIDLVAAESTYSIEGI